MSYDTYNSTHHHQGCVDPNNKLIVVYPIVTHVVTPLASQCDIINSLCGTLTSHFDVIWKVLHFEVTSSSFWQRTKQLQFRVYRKSPFSSDESPFVTKPVRIPHYGSHHLNGCSAFVPVLLCLVHQPIIINRINIKSCCQQTIEYPSECRGDRFHTSQWHLDMFCLRQPAFAPSNTILVHLESRDYASPPPL